MGIDKHIFGEAIHPFANAGEQLTSACVPILELLAAVPQAEEADTMHLAFQSMQLLCSDYTEQSHPVLCLSS